MRRVLFAFLLSFSLSADDTNSLLIVPTKSEPQFKAVEVSRFVTRETPRLRLVYGRDEAYAEELIVEVDTVYDTFRERFVSRYEICNMGRRPVLVRWELLERQFGGTLVLVRPLCAASGKFVTSEQPIVENNTLTIFEKKEEGEGTEFWLPVRVFSLKAEWIAGK